MALAGGRIHSELFQNFDRTFKRESANFSSQYTKDVMPHSKDRI